MLYNIAIQVHFYTIIANAPKRQVSGMPNAVNDEQKESITRLSFIYWLVWL